MKHYIKMVEGKVITQHNINGIDFSEKNKTIQMTS